MDNSQKVLVTGATGLVGVHILIDLINSGFKNITALYRTDNALIKAKNIAEYYNIGDPFDRLNWVKFDLTQKHWEEQMFRSVDIVIHTAAMVSFDPSENSEMKLVNEVSTKKLLDFASSAKVKKFGFISSVASLGRKSGENVYLENNEWIDSNLNSYYSITKYNAEQLVLKANNKSMSTYIINPGVILGPCDWNKSSGTIFRSGKKGLLFYTAGGNGFVDVRDVSHGLLQIMEHGEAAERYIAVGHNMKFKKLFSDIQIAFENKPPKLKASKLVTGLGWRLDKLVSKIVKRSPVLTKHSASASHNTSVYLNEKMSNVKGVSFKEWEDTIQNAVNYFKSDNKG